MNNNHIIYIYNIYSLILNYIYINKEWVNICKKVYSNRDTTAVMIYERIGDSCDFGYEAVNVNELTGNLLHKKLKFL